MSIFGNNGYIDSPVDVDNIVAEESRFSEPFQAGMDLLVESEENFNNIMKAIAYDELYVYESTGHEIIYEAGTLKNILDKIKEFFVKLWEKIKGIFKKFFAMINSWTMTDKEFIKKYRADLVKVRLTDFEYKGYKFTNLNDVITYKDEASVLTALNAGITGKKQLRSLNEINGYTDATADVITKYNTDEYSMSTDEEDRYKNKFRAALLVNKKNGGDEIEASDFATELKEYFRDGESSPSSYDLTDIQPVLAEIESTKDVKKKADDAFKSLKRVLDSVIKSYDRAASQTGKNISGTPDKAITAAQSKYYTTTSNGLKFALQACETYTTALLQAIKDQNRQCKSICIKALTYKPKNESAGFVHTEGSFLNNVVLR